MKVITYNLSGDGSNRPLIPDAVETIRRASKESAHLSQTLADFIDSFRTAGKPVILNPETVKANPDKLLFIGADCKDGITTRTYCGWHTVDFDPSLGSDTDFGLIITVTVNEYDETATHTVIENDGKSEYLAPLPVYMPVNGAPGLYKKVK